MRRSYTANFKLKVIDFAETNENWADSREYNVDEKCIRGNRGKVPQWPELEEELKN